MKTIIIILVQIVELITDIIEEQRSRVVGLEWGTKQKEKADKLLGKLNEIEKDLK